MIDWPTVGIIATLLTIVCTFFLWAVNAIVAPLKVSVDNNSELIREVVLDHKDLRSKVNAQGNDIANLQPRVSSLEKFQDRYQEATL